MNRKGKIIIALVLISPLITAFLMMSLEKNPPLIESKNPITFMTYNIHFGQGGDDLLNLERIAQNILLDDPDIIGLQEVERGRITSQGVDMAYWLAKRLNMYYYYFNPPSNKHVMGNAILSKFPIVSARGYSLPSILQERVYIHCIIRVSPTLTLDVFNTHLGIRNENKYAQVNYLLNKIVELSTPSTPTLLMGDLNLRRTSPEIQPLLTYFTDTGSIVASSERANIDYILVRGHESIIEYHVVNDMLPNIDSPAEFGSDHLPVVSTILF
ncbi:MAG: endonuclease/exonuclease/phosphatase family protein [Promethearchaeota archaeon]